MVSIVREKLKIELPYRGRSRELLRKFSKKGFHGELVVTLNSQGEIHLTVYSLERDKQGNLKHITYRIV